MVRLPGFEPGSSTWQADVLNQARLQPLQTSLRHFSIVEVLLKLRLSGLSDGSLKTISDNLKRLAKYVDLNNPDEVKLYVANLKVENSFKNQLLKCYGYFLNINGIQWSKPYYRYERKIPRIKHKDKILQVISASKKYAVIFKILYETGIMPYELSKCTKNDIDMQDRVLTVQGYKGHMSRSFKLSNETVAMLSVYFVKYAKFPDAYWICRMWRQARDKVASKLQDADIKAIQLYDLRRYYATHLYDITKDLLLVKQQL